MRTVKVQGPVPRGRGSRDNPTGRFEVLAVETDLSEDALFAEEREALAAARQGGGAADGGPGSDPEGMPGSRVPTQFLRDTARSIISTNRSPDVPFDVSLNPYRGCEHGCAYCYARPTHEYLGFSAGLDFETRIMVKEEAPRLLREQLCDPRWKPQVLAMSGVTDPYQPVERKLGITAACLEVLAELRHPVSVITKNHLVTRDLEALGRLASHRAACVTLSLTTLDPELARRLEPRASHPRRRLQAIRQLREAGVPVGVLVAPVIPGLNDHEIPALLQAAAEAGAGYARYVMLRLPHGIKDLMSDWLEQHAPERKERVLARVREVRGGQLYDTRFGQRMRGEGVYAGQVGDLFQQVQRRLGLDGPGPELSTEAFRAPGRQLDLFA